MKLDAVKLGIAVAIVAAIVSVIGALFLFTGPYGAMRGGYGWMHGAAAMHGGYWHGGAGGFGWGRLVAGIILRPLLAGVAAWGTAAIYNRLLGKPAESAGGE